MQNFVSVALSTAAGGEGDLVNDQLSDLRTVGRGYGSLIYDWTPNAGFLEFKEHCKPLWDFLDHTSALPDLLVSVLTIIVKSIVKFYYYVQNILFICRMNVTANLIGTKP